MNQEQLKELFVQYLQENKGIIYKICQVYCPDKNEREDLAQEMVYELWKSFPRFDPAYRFSTWMYRIALNVAISFYRKEKKSITAIPFSESLLLFEESGDADTDKENNLFLLQQFISRLKEMDRSIILLYLDDRSYREMAEIIGTTETNIATRLNRIKDKLKQNFAQHNHQ
jgi:RNA polymerase sigma-70 factor (ECF subfamily)